MYHATPSAQLPEIIIVAPDHVVPSRVLAVREPVPAAAQCFAVGPDPLVVSSLSALIDPLEHALAASVGYQPTVWYLPTADARAPEDWAHEAMLQQLVPSTLRTIPPGAARLEASEFAAALAEPIAVREGLLVAALIHGDRLLVWRATGDVLRVATARFVPAGDGTAPDFSDCEVTDSGLTLRFGAYEAAVDAILYEADPAYRRQRKSEQHLLDDSLGGSLRRLRLLRGLRQTDFAPHISEREIRRLENNEVRDVHEATREALEQILNVSFEQISSY